MSSHFPPPPPPLASLVDTRKTTWRDSGRGITSAIYLLIYQDEIVYLGQSGDLHARLAWHQTYKRYDRIRVLPLPDNRRTRSYVEKHIRDLIGPTFYGNGESVRDRIEMRRKGDPVDAEALAGTGPIVGIVAFLRWGLA